MMFDNSNCVMDVSLEELLQEADLDEDINDFDENDDAVLIQNDLSDYDDNEDVKLPPELSDYFSYLESQTQQLEEELEECDELLLYTPHQSKGPSEAVVLFDEFKTLEQSAEEYGMTLDEFKQKILADLEQENFTEEDVNCEFEEFLQLQQELADIRSSIILDRSDDQKAILAPEENTDNGCDEPESSGKTVLAIENVAVGSEAVGEYKPTDCESKQTEGSIVSCSDLSNMRDYVIEQLRKNDESHEVLSLNLAKFIEKGKHEEEKRMLEQEEQGLKFKQLHDKEEAAMMERLKENERVLEEGQKVRDEEITQELIVHQAVIDKISETLEKERYQYEMSQVQLMEKLEATIQQAATRIQKVYRGHRARRQNKRAIQELKEWEEVRKKEKHKLRVLEVEYEMKHREEQALREKENQERIAAEERIKKEEEKRQIEIEQKKKEETERIIEELRKEKEKRKEEKRLEEEQRKKEEEELRKREEKRRLEEEKLKKEEEMIRRNEEKKRQKEEKQRKKDEIKKKKEEEKRIKEEEKRKKEEEKRIKEEEKMKEEEKRKKEEEKRIKEEEKRKTEEKNNIEEEEMRKKEENMKEMKKKEKEIVNGTEDAKVQKDYNSNKEENMKNKTENMKQVEKAKPKKDEIMPEDANVNKISEIRAHRNIQQGVNNSSPHVGPISGSNGQQIMSSGLISGELSSAHESLKSFPCTPAVEHATDKSLLLQPLLTSGIISATPQEPVTASTRLPPSIFYSIELQRSNWIKSCILWSKVSCEPWKLKQASHKSYKRPSQAKKLLPLSQSMVLDAAHASSLREVSSLKLTGLSECSMSTLGQCWSLRYLTITKCGLMFLDGLSQCQHLLYINAENNNIEYVDLKDLGSLQVVRLAHNNLSVIHGFEGCINLRWLGLSHNRITRISGLSSLRRAHTLDLSNNQIVSTQGLEEASTLQYLDLSHNYLQHLTDVSKLCLLTDLNLSCNNLLEVPELKNQILLQTLHLQENSIKSLEPMDKCWLPLLCALDCSQNMLENVTGLSSLIHLSHLDVSLNQITDMENLLPGIAQNGRLETLMLEGNPLVDLYNEDYKQIIARASPLLKSVDHQSVNTPEIKSPTTKSETEFGMITSDNFIQMCLSQIRLHAALRNEFETQMKVLLVNCHVTGETLCSTYFTFCDTSFKMASEHRLAHEYGDSCASNSVSNFTVSIMDVKAKFDSAVEIKQQQDDEKSDKNQTSKSEKICEQISELDFVQDKLAYNESKPNKQSQFNSAMFGGDRNVISNSLNSATPHNRFSSLTTNEHSAKDSADIQDKHYIKQDSLYSDGFARDRQQHNTSHNNLSTNSDQYTSGKDKFEMLLLAQTSSSATTDNNKNRIDETTQESIVASQPRNLDGNLSLSGVKASVVGSQLTSQGTNGRSDGLELPTHDLDENFDFESMGFDIDKYFDMEELDEFLDKGWRPADFSQNIFPVLDKISSRDSNIINLDKGHSKGHDSSLLQPPHQPSYAWMLSSASTELKTKSPHPTHGFGAAPSPFSAASAAETINCGSFRSKKEELTEEWGFKDSSTVETMLARAKKMKYNSERRRKLSQLDPQQRYHLLKKMEEKYRITITRPPSTKVLPRKEYFKAREEEMQRQRYEGQAEDNTRAHHLFEWLHTQIGDHNVSSSRINPGANSGFTCNDNTKNAIGEIHAREFSPLSDHQKPVFKDIQTVRRYSTGETQSGHTPVLPPIQRGSLPASHMKERISFRDSPVVRSGGWGGGRKREHRK